MSTQSAKRMSEEQPLVQQMVQSEPTPDSAIAMPDTPEHRAAVVKIINFAFGWVDEGFKLGARLTTARALITAMRERSPANARSLRLRDAERYLWGRSYVPSALDADKTRNPDVVRAEAEFADTAYQTMKAFNMAVNSIFGTNWGKSNPNNPFSALGGGPWYDLGLKHYDQFDDGHLGEKVEPHRLTISEVQNDPGFFHAPPRPRVPR